MTDLDLPALKELCEAATEGPWHANLKKWGDEDCDWEILVANGWNPAMNKENATFIAAARTALPQLIEKIEELESHCCAFQEGSEDSQEESRQYALENTALKTRISALEAQIRQSTDA